MYPLCIVLCCLESETMAELETQHEQLDAILRDLMQPRPVFELCHNRNKMIDSKREVLIMLVNSNKV